MMLAVSIAVLMTLLRGGEGLLTVSPQGCSSPPDTAFGNSRYLLDSPFFVNLPTFDSFRDGSIPLVCIENALELSRISAWKQDAQSLRSLSFGASAGVASGKSDIRKGVHQVWLQSPECPPLQNFVGKIDARKDLLRFVDAIRHSLNHGLAARSMPPELVELSYLLYDANGAAYAMHVDSFADDSTSDRKRCVSFLFYLGDNNEDLLWDCARDGGALRVHGENYALATGQPIYRNQQGEVWSEITPKPGTIVLFESATVPHEVVSTYRNRICVVGWLGTYRD